MQVFFILFSVHFAVYQYINSKCLYRTHVILVFVLCMPSLVHIIPLHKKAAQSPLGAAILA